MDKCTKLVIKQSTGFSGLMICKKLVMDEMYEIGHFIAKFEYEYSRICVVSIVRTNFVLLVKLTLMSLMWLFALCLYIWLFGIYDSGNWVVCVAVAI